MKANIHPKYNESAQVVCSCGNMFTVGSTSDNIRVELCNRCHPMFTGQQRFVDTASRIDKYKKREQMAKPRLEKKKEEKKEETGPMTLREMLQSIKK